MTFYQGKRRMSSVCTGNKNGGISIRDSKGRLGLQQVKGIEFAKAKISSE